VERIVVEAGHHVAGETAAERALVIGAQRQTDRVQPEIGAAALVRDREAVAADPELARSDHRVADAAGADDDDAAVARAMGSDARVVAAIHVDDGADGSRPRFELPERPLASAAGEPDWGMGEAQRFEAEPRLVDRRAARLLDFAERAVDAEPQRGRTRD